ncbi:chromosome segregation ATPase-like protein [Rhizoctonia solani AG-1 IB]|uniref:Chromosome segregation ATPase-like protein n=1 Tax=Thanatephorus cucumeris (strain AG1-IB / isolate 7/3/14) TaxID=1108050 RepID=M5BXU6_THACB|nr:chromosome segregation ATPase-like protein [Rhizoctonia solani AG-1 IB]
MPKPRSTPSWSSGNRLAPPASTTFGRTPSVLREDDESGIGANDSAEVDINGDPISRADRAKSPLYDALGAAGSFLINQARRATSRQPEDSASTTNIQQSLSSVDRTSDYEDAEALYQRAKAGLTIPEPEPDTSKTSNTSKKKPRKSRDNALYKPSESEEEESDGFDSDEGKRKKKHKLVKGMSLPIIGPSKTGRSRKLRRQSSRASASMLGDGDLHSVSNLMQVDEEQSILPPSRGRTQSRSRSRSHTPRSQSVSGHTTDSMAEEQALEDALVDDDSNAYTDPEVAQQSREIAGSQLTARSSSHSSFSYSPKRNSKGLGVGAALGTFVRSVMRALLSLKKLNHDVKVVLSILVVLSALYIGIFRSSSTAKPALPSHYEHTPMPKFDMPPGSLEELIERLAVLERAQRSTDTAIGDMSSRVGSVEGYVGNVDARVGQVDTRMVTMETRVGTVETKVTRVDERVAKADDRLDRFDIKVEQVGNRAEDVGLQVGKVDKLARDIDTRVNQADSRIGQVDTRVVQMDGWFTQAETKFDQLGSRIGHVERSGAKTGKPEGKGSYSDSQVREMEARTREIELKAKEIEGHVKRFEGRAKEFDSKTASLDSKTKDIDSKTKELDAKSREHDTKTRDFESKLREIEAKFKDASGSSWWRGTRSGSQQEQLAIGPEAMDQIVQRAVLATTKDTVMRADFALYTGGGRVIPDARALASRCARS